MGVEIERKFLVTDDSWRAAVSRSEHLRDGLLARFGEGKVRVRICSSQATLTVKGAKTGLCRPEFEYPIPFHEAELLLKMSTVPVLEKTRHFVQHGSDVWKIDAYEGPLEDVVLAEIELEREDQEVELPPWVGREVTADPAFRKANLLQLRAEGAGDRPDGAPIRTSP